MRGAALLTALGLLLLGCGGGPGPAPLPGLQVLRPPHEVSALAVRGDRLYAGGREGVFEIERRSGRVLRRLEAPRPLRYVRALAVDGAGVLWIGSGEGLWGWDGAAGWREVRAGQGLPDDRVNVLEVDRQGRLWAGTWGGAAVLEGERWSVLRKSDGLADDMVNVLLQDDGGGLWFGSYTAPRGGLSHRAPDGRWSRWTVAEGLPHNNVNGLFQDRDGAVWACTGFLDRGGACRFVRRQGRWTLDRVLTVREGLAGAKSRSLFQDDHGVYWFGSEYDGTARMDGAYHRVLTRDDGFSGNEVKSILQDGDGVLWFATEDGVTRLGPEGAEALARQTGSGGTS